MKYSPSHLTPFPPTFPGKTACKSILSSKNSARAPASPLSTFRMNTCKSVSKQRTLSTSRMNTYAKTGGGGSHGSAPIFRIRLPRIPLRAHHRTDPFVFRYLQIPCRANPFFSHPYKTPGVSPHHRLQSLLCACCVLCALCVKFFLDPFSLSI